MTKQEILQINTSTLAYLGDAVYELMIREWLIDKHPNSVDKSHRTAIKYVSAEGQSKAAKTMMVNAFLSEEEERLLKRARNHRTMSKPANADPKNYKVATGFEALIGYLHLLGDEERLREVVEKAIQIIND